MASFLNYKVDIRHGAYGRQQRIIEIALDKICMMQIGRQKNATDRNITHVLQKMEVCFRRIMTRFN